MNLASASLYSQSAARGQAVLAQHELLMLINSEGWFPDDLVRPGVRYCLCPTCGRLQAEFRAQFGSFYAAGLELSRASSYTRIYGA